MQRWNAPQIHAVLADLGLPDLAVIADTAGIAALEARAAGALSFAEALRQALTAFLSDARGSPDQGHDSALDVIRSAPDSYGLGADPSPAELTAVLHAMLADDPNARIVLLTDATVAEPDYRFLPEYGESIAEHWVFRIIAPAGWPFLQWAIVDLRGTAPAYSYTFD